MQIVTLVLVLLLPNSQTETRHREFRGAESLRECNAAQEAAHRAARWSFDVMDVGSICVPLSVKPRA